MQELEAMEAVGKLELQCLFGHPDGIGYLSSSYLPQAILQHDYIWGALVVTKQIQALNFLNGHKVSDIGAKAPHVAISKPKAQM
jgi:hypothetical protein